MNAKSTTDPAAPFAQRFAAAPCAQRFAAAPTVRAFAPGRVNLIGEHTDYNDGFVMPMAIQYGVRVAGRLTDAGRVRAVSANFEERPGDFPLQTEPDGHDWIDFLQAVLLELDAVGVKPAGLELAYVGDVPDGAGLSSSAAFAVATVLAVSRLVGRRWDDPVALSRVCQAAEHRIGTRCGLLDQMASAACRAGSAMLLDCRDMSRTMLPIDRERLAVIVGATGVKRELAASKYNERRAECEQGARLCGQTSLREVTPAMLGAQRDALPENIYRRCKHVLSENERVHRFAAALRAGDTAALGAIADEGHASLRDDYEVSCVELDAMVESFTACAGVYGARMVGGGFGGSAIALVDPARAADIMTAAAQAYAAKTGRQGRFYTATAGDGAVVESLD